MAGNYLTASLNPEFSSDEEKTLWQKIMQTQSQPSNPLEANFSPATNLQVTAAQAPADPQQPAPLMNPFLAQMSGASGASARNRSQIEGRINALIDGSTNSPEMGAQRQTISDFQNKLKEYSQNGPNTSGLAGVNLAPLMALSDAWTGSNFAKTYKAPETQKERAEKVLAMTGQLGGLQGALTKEQTDLLKDKLTALVGVDKANQDRNMMTTMFNRTDETAHRTVLQDVKKDPILNARLTQATNLSNAMAAYDQAEVKGPQQIDALQQSIRSNMGIKGTSGLSEREKDYFNNMGLNANRVEQYLFSKPVNSNQDALVSHLRDLVSVEQGNIRSQAQYQIRKLSAGNEAMYARRPDLYQGLMSLVDISGQQFDPRNLAGPGKKGAMSPEAGGRAPLGVPAPQPKKSQTGGWDDLKDQELQQLYNQHVKGSGT